jgi:hypothetical protein
MRCTHHIYGTVVLDFLAERVSVGPGWYFVGKYYPDYPMLVSD